MPCVDLAIAPKGHEFINKFEENYIKEFGLKNPTIKEFDDDNSLMEFVTGSGLGQARSAVYLGEENTMGVFTRAKTQNVDIDDSATANSVLPRLHSIATATFLPEAPVSLNYTVIDSSAELSRQYGLSAQITAFSYIFLILGIGVIAIVGKLKDKRIYEYLVVSGLNRVRFYLGSLGYIAIEMLVAVIVVQIFFVAFDIINTSAGNNFFVPIFLFPAAVAFCGCFGLFSFAVLNSMGAVITFFICVGFIPGYVMTAIVVSV